MTWQPNASIPALQERANFYRYLREFFLQRSVLEVETPMLSKAAVSDANLQPVSAQVMNAPAFLHTSPEYPMKRLLAAGSGDIYQICKTFRDGEQGNRHNPEFSMLEYYRLGFNLETLMDEVAQLVGDYLAIQQRQNFTYAQALDTYADLDPFNMSDDELRARCNEFVGTDVDLGRDACLDIIMSHVVEPQLPKNTLVFIYNYPASQAALAKTYERFDGIQVAKRFELYVNGLELANGYDELVDVQEQKSRFDVEAKKREHEQRVDDEYFLQALASGLPDCSGVAIGLDRILMLKLGLSNISDVLSFDFSRA
ncbi:EF-P lysine aminoacylase GenX [Bermanella marisrubri]|uniref:Lysyl-tRNA synthetase n=1 Tax=Bermanella marisrubri TaxID=207949 RepID=Q1N222_9GAMM|nr:EF-P lysine aminoacylase EpmA [Bermanella marisrubri]EAT12342.1 lysyl-tRNA synthetase [Bermanella marisrubri]QIZ85425.1 EF-P lysine aminoacylase GenX [Bermanella marisrubri]